MEEGILKLLKLLSLKVISRCGAGIDNVHLEAAERLGIKRFTILLMRQL